MEQYKNELQAALNELAEVSEALLHSVPYTEDYAQLLMISNDLLLKIREIEDRRRQEFLQKEEENDG